MRLDCVFSPALRGDENHTFDLRGWVERAEPQDDMPRASRGEPA